MIERPESRQSPRFAVEIQTQVFADGHSLVAIAKDMSRGGICLICPKEVETGSDLKLSLALALGESPFSELLKLAGRVVWCTKIDFMYQVGVMFTEMTSEKMGCLEMFLRFLEQEIVITGEGPSGSVRK